MKRIETVKQKYFEVLKSIHCKEMGDLCDKEFCACSRLAEIRAYFHATLPEKHRNLTLENYIGVTDCGTNLSPKSITGARNKICQYCWGISWDKIKEQTGLSETKDIVEELDKRQSILPYRYDVGNSVVIYGDEDRPLGRTLVASLIMREAIKLRKNSVQRSSTYGWVNMATLKQSLVKEGERDNVSLDVTNYKYADWLVIDNITTKEVSVAQTSIKQRAFMSDLFDPFIDARRKRNLPTILIFKFDINEHYKMIEEGLGQSVVEILNSSSTCKISLEVSDE